MRRSTVIIVLAAACLNSGQTVRAQPLYQEWKPLFNGKDLTGWKTHPKQPGHWRVEDGAIVGSGNAVSHLFSEPGEFSAFQFRAEARISAAGNSGLYFRCEYGLSLRDNYPAGYEAQICLPGSREDQLTGSLYGFAPVKESLVKPNQWFTMEVVGDGRFIAITVDGKKVVDFKDEKNTYHSAANGRNQMKKACLGLNKVSLPRHTLPNRGMP